MSNLLKALSALVLLLLAGAGYAQAPQKRVALVIANARYVNAGVLANPANDARIVAAAFRRAGFQSVTVASDIDIARFRTTLRAFRTAAQGAQVAAIYYAGHGIEAAGRNWLIPVDARLESDGDLPDEAIDLDRVVSDMAGARVRMVLLDACRNNPFGRSWRVATRSVTRGLAPVEADDVLVVYAAAPGQTAADGTGSNSPFALAVAQRLAEPGTPVQLLGNVVRDDVLRQTGNRQRPFVSASMTGTPIYLVAPSSASPPVPIPAAPAASIVGTWRPTSTPCITWYRIRRVGARFEMDEKVNPASAWKLMPTTFRSGDDRRFTVAISGLAYTYEATGDVMIQHGPLGLNCTFRRVPG